MKRTIIIKDAPAKSPAVVAGGAEIKSPPGKAWMIRSAISAACALVADGLQWLFPPGWVVYDGAMVVALLLIWGWRWEIAVAVIPEIVPGLDLFPTWTLFVGYLIASRRKK